MGRRRALIWLGAEGAVCLALALTWQPDGTVMAGLLRFPFAPLGRALRGLSLSGPAGNGLALALYALVCLLPMGYLTARLIRRRARAEDGLLAAMSGVAFAVVYWGVNPSLMPTAIAPMGTALGGGVFWSLAAAYLVLRALRGCMGADEAHLCRCARLMLWALAAVSVFGACGASPLGLINGIRQLRAANPGFTSTLGATYLLLGCRGTVSAGAYLLDTAVVLGALDLLTVWERAPYSGEAVDAAGKLSRRCAQALVFSALSGAALALAQFLLAGRLNDVSVSVTVPLLPMGLVLAALLLAQYIRAGKRLKDDNDLFI